MRLPTRLGSLGAIPVLVIIETIIFSLFAPRFMTSNNLFNILYNASALAIIAAGMTLVILLAGIDISAGPMVGVIGWCVAELASTGFPAVGTVLIAVGLGAGFGLLNGLLVVRGRVAPIIATLGTAAIFKSVLFVLWDSQDVFTGPVLSILGPTRWWFIPRASLLVAVVYLALAFGLKRTPWGRGIYAIGNDAEGARLLGVPVRSVTLSTYACVGCLAGLTALAYVSRVGVIQSNSGDELTLAAIAAVVIGGTSILGGRGGVGRTLLGVLFVAILSNGLVLIGVPSIWSGVFVGGAVAAAAVIDVLGRKRTNSLLEVS